MNGNARGNSYRSGCHSYCVDTVCCLDSPGGESMNPMSVTGTIPAGRVCEKYDGTGYDGCMLANAYFVNQEYKAGLTPEKALCNGTFFPELIRLYK